MNQPMTLPPEANPPMVLPIPLLPVPESRPLELMLYLDTAIVGTKFESSFRVDGHISRPVQLHCVEVQYDMAQKDESLRRPKIKRFKVFSHGLEIREVQATKEDGKWVPR